MTREGPHPAVAAVAARWRALGQRERVGVTIAGVIAGAAGLWLLAVQPAWRTLREAPVRLEQMDGQLQAMQRHAAEARELRATPKLAPGQAAAALTAATARLVDKGSLSVVGDRGTLTLNGASGEQLRGWLNEARTAARARVTEANLTRGPQGLSGTVAVTFGATP